MTETGIYHDIAARTEGAFLLGVVGPVRTGKSTFIKRFMEMMVIPEINNEYMRERAKDELPQSGSGRTIMTAEPKFIPEEAVDIELEGNTRLSVRLVDCVGYMVNGAAGQFENGEERLVSTPWYDHEITMSDAAEKGTHKVITEHSTIGIVVTTDGTVCDIPRAQYEEPEERVINELKTIGKPFSVILNSSEPDSEAAKALAEEISYKYGVNCLCMNCLEMTRADINSVMLSVLEDFPLQSMAVYLPDWVDSMPNSTALKQQLFNEIAQAGCDAQKIRDCSLFASKLGCCSEISSAGIENSDLGTGEISVRIQMPRSLYYKTISDETGLEVNNDGELMAMLTAMSEMKADYDSMRSAIESVREFGYGVVMPDASQMELEEPQIVKQNGKYTVKLKASAPAIHMLMTRIETEVTPTIGGETASEDILNFLLQGFDGDVNKIWQSNIFGKSLNDIAEEGLTSKIEALPDSAKMKLRLTLQRIVNEGSGGLICILL